ncbi:MAG: D-glycero-beta-D-manno-heptose 1,7-bisphosphate 7-phosphatase [Caldilineaceae bacterium]
MHGILLDRDGVINRERADYVKSWDEFEFLPGVLAAIQRLATLSIPIVVITNQSVIGRGIVNRTAIDAIHQRAQIEIAAAGGRIDAVFLCPHHPSARCDCRKPQPGLLYQAADQFALNLADTIFIGDSITDYQAAETAGCQSILVRSGRQGEKLPTLIAQEQQSARLIGRPASQPPLVADLSAAVELILEQRVSHDIAPVAAKLD